MSADAMGAILESRPQDLGCDGQNNLTGKGKASIRWQTEEGQGDEVAGESKVGRARHSGMACCVLTRVQVGLAGRWHHVVETARFCG